MKRSTQCKSSGPEAKKKKVGAKTDQAPVLQSEQSIDGSTTQSNSTQQADTLVVPTHVSEEMAVYKDAQLVRDSRLLHQLCCDVGFSRKHWKHSVEFSELLNTCHGYRGYFAHEYACFSQFSGSFAEGVAADFLGSDIDIMYIVTGTSAVEDGQFSIKDKDHLFQILLTRHPAFVRLKCIQRSDATDIRFFVTPIVCSDDKYGNSVLNGTALKLLLTYGGGGTVLKLTMHGPAQKTMLELQPDKEYDHVLSLHCRDWPSPAREWIDRVRQYNWPKSSDIKEAISNGGELVAVGNVENLGQEEFEWRLSSSFAEKILVKSFNIIQIQCYFLLKLLLAFRIRPLVRDGLCSYHMKIVILHVVENTDPMQWKVDNLAQCFMTCLQSLLDFLEIGYLPQFFILQHNLLRPKVQGATRRAIIDIVRGFQSEGWKCTLSCAPFSCIGLPCDQRETRCRWYVNHWEGEMFSKTGILSRETIQDLVKTNADILNAYSKNTFQKSVEGLLKVISFDDSKHRRYFPSVSSVSLMKRMLKSHVGYMLLNAIRGKRSVRNHRLYGMLNVCRRFLEEGCKVDLTSCILKLATFFYQTGQILKCLETVVSVHGRYSVNTMPVCDDDFRNERYQEHVRIISFFQSLRPGNVRFPELVGQVAFPVTFSHWEIPCAPPEIKQLIDQQQYTLVDRRRLKFIHIDPEPYMYYLLSVSYRNIGNYDQARRCLKNMWSIVQEPSEHMLYYPEIAEKLLAICERTI